MIYIFYSFVISFLLLGMIVIGEVLVTKFPKTKFNKFWRKYVVMDADEERWD